MKCQRCPIVNCFVVKRKLPTSGRPVERDLTREDFPTLGAPMKTTVGLSRSMQGALRIAFWASTNCWKTGSWLMTSSHISSIAASAMKVAKRPRSALEQALPLARAVSLRRCLKAFKQPKSLPKAAPLVCMWLVKETSTLRRSKGCNCLMSLGYSRTRLSSAQRKSLTQCTRIAPYLRNRALVSFTFVSILIADFHVISLRHWFTKSMAVFSTSISLI
mmetsp:Transcript_60737/g.130472  ORF Transcript_60737/g.130472 Transcript_60737/m.130472 type:complete len:218 (-) Transcript_60737:673-1326(-)